MHISIKASIFILATLSLSLSCKCDTNGTNFVTSVCSNSSYADFCKKTLRSIPSCLVGFSIPSKAKVVRCLLRSLITTSIKSAINVTELAKKASGGLPVGEECVEAMDDVIGDLNQSIDYLNENDKTGNDDFLNKVEEIVKGVATDACDGVDLQGIPENVKKLIAVLLLVANLLI